MKNKEMADYVSDKRITRAELQENFRLIKTFDVVRGDLSKCGNCGDTANIANLPSESWTSALYCWKCQSITLMTHADQMSGNYTDSYEVYGV